VNWTVDVGTIFDRRLMMDIQVSSPYLNPNQGEGIYIVPEVGAKCLVCIPSDGPPPFVLAFIMPVVTQQIADAEGEETNQRSSATYAGGRRRGKPGDIIARGRDGNFMILHRGGVAQFGSGPLAQRICIPLQNLVTDISQNYNHFNGGGSVNWGVQDKGSNDPTSEFRGTYRVYANDEYADIRVDMGYVQSPTGEPTGDAGEDSNNNQLGIGTSEPVVLEFALARNGFETDSGEFTASPADVKLRVFIDRGGNMMARWEGSVDLRVKKKLRLTVDDDVAIFCKKNASITADGSLKLIGSKGAELGTGGGVLTFNNGSKPLSTVGSIVSIIIPPGVLQVISPTGSPIGVVGPGTLEGVVKTGNPTLLG
jgi:hypothetical protein